VSAFAESRHSLTFKIGTPLRELERKAIDITLQHTRGDKNMAARLLGIATRTIYRHLEKHDDSEDETDSQAEDYDPSPSKMLM
jgi:two-component system response regulator HydG